MMKFIKNSLIVIISLLVILVSVFAQKDIPKQEMIKKYTNNDSKFIPIMGMNVHYRDQGNALDSIPLVLIHGTSSSLHTWGKSDYYIKSTILWKQKGYQFGYACLWINGTESSERLFI